MGQRYELLQTPARDRAVSCEECGALVVRTEVHDSWHERLEAKARVLLTVAKILGPRAELVTAEEYNSLTDYVKGGS